MGSTTVVNSNDDGGMLLDTDASPTDRLCHSVIMFDVSGVVSTTHVFHAGTAHVDKTCLGTKRKE